MDSVKVQSQGGHGKDSSGLVEGGETATFVFMCVKREQLETLVIIRG